MRKPVLALLLVLAACSRTLSLPMNASVTTLPNGLTLVMQEDHAAELVGIDIWVKAGSRFETPEKNGVSHFIEHLLFGVTEKRKAGDMDREMESLGATLDAHTNRDYTHFGTTISSRFLPKALDVLSDAILNPQFPEAGIQNERMVILDEVARKQSDATLVCQDLLAERLFGVHPYSMPIEGTPERIKALSRQDIVDYYHRYYVPANIAVVLVGDFDKAAAISAITTAFGSAPAAVSKETSPPTATKERQLPGSLKMDFKNDYLALGFLGPSAADTDEVCAIDVLLTYLGQGYHSWLSDELKDKQGLALQASADFITAHDPGLISIIVATKSTDIPKAKDAILAKLRQMSTMSLDSYDLDRAKRALLGQYAFQNETVGGRAGTIGFYYAVSDASFASKYEAAVQAVTADSVSAAVKKYLDPNAAVAIAVGPDEGGAK